MALLTPLSSRECCNEDSTLTFVEDGVNSLTYFLSVNLTINITCFDNFDPGWLKEELSDVNTEIEAMDTEEGAKMKSLQMGKKKFNMDPKKGVEYLISHDLIKETPEDVAAFLYKGEGLNKTMIGDYLGERNDFNEAVLKAFVELHDFTDLIVVKSFRTIFEV